MLHVATVDNLACTAFTWKQDSSSILVRRARGYMCGVVLTVALVNHIRVGARRIVERKHTDVHTKSRKDTDSQPPVTRVCMLPVLYHLPFPARVTLNALNADFTFSSRHP